MKIISRYEAKALGLKRYFTGVVCKRGHFSERATNNGNCYSCCAESTKKYRTMNREKTMHCLKTWRENKKEKIKEYSKKYYSENKKLRSEKFSKWYEKNKDYKLEQKKIWAKNNQEKIKLYSKQYRKKNKILFRKYKSKRRCLLKNSNKNYEVSDVKKELKLQKYKCIYCKVNIKNNYHIDHIIPLSKGGSNGSDNIQILCPSCNLSKGAKNPYEWAQKEKGLLL